MKTNADLPEWGAGQPPASVESLVDTCRALERQGRLAEALQLAAHALALAVSQGDNLAACLALAAGAQVRFRLGQYGEASAMVGQVIDRAPEKSLAMANALLLRGMCAAETSSLDQAEQDYRQAADLALEMGYGEVRCRALHDLASGVYLPRGHFDLSIKLDEEALHLAEANGFSEWLYFPLTTIAWACHLTGQRQRLRQTLGDLARVLSPEWAAYGFYEYFAAELALDEGDLDRGRAMMNRAFSSGETSGDPALTIFARLGMSRCHLLAGSPASARSWASDALARASRYGYHHFIGQALIERGRTAWLSGNFSAAEEDLEAAVLVLDTLGAAFDLARARLVLAGLRWQQCFAESAGRRPAGACVEQEALLALQAVLFGGYEHLLDQEREIALSLVAGHSSSANRQLAEVCRQLMERFTRLPPDPLRVITLGRFEVWQGRRKIDKRLLNKRRAGELLACLMVAPGRALPFDLVAEMMYPEKDFDSARSSFHHATSALRRALEPGLPEKFPSRYLKVEEGRVSLRLPEGSQVDFEDFEAACLENRWEAALDLYAGDLLDEYRYSPGLTEPRQRFSLFIQRALLATAEEKLNSGQYRAALDFSRRLLEMEPWQEPPVAVGMRACLGLNDRAGALRLYRQLAQALREELDLEPCEELQELARQISRK